MNRRTLLKGLLAATAVAVVGKLLPAIPEIWGDGIHDDGPGIQAALEGKPFNPTNSGVRYIEPGVLFLPSGVYLV